MPTRVTYSSQDLHTIGQLVQHRRSMSVLSPHVVSIVRNLRLARNKRNKRGKRGGKEQRKRQVQNEELFQDMPPKIDTTLSANKSQHIHMSLVNARSIKNKDIMIMTEIKENNIDICVITETWLNTLDEAWVSGSEFNCDAYSVSTVNRKKGRGGGLALVYRRGATVKLKSCANKNTFEYAIWEFKNRKSTINIFAVYRPPYSQKHQRTIPQFIDEFLETVSDEIAEIDNVVILGDLNIHVDKVDDPEAQAMVESMEALGFDQKVNFETHMKGHILDHVYVPETSNIKIVECMPGTFISDHRLIICKLSIIKEEVTTKTITGRIYRKLDTDKFKDLVDFGDMNENDDLEYLVNQMNSTTTKLLDKLIPEKTMKITERRKELWYNNRIRDQRAVVRRRERIWRGYREEHQLIAFKSERNRWNRMLFKAKIDVISNEVIKCGKDTRALFKLINNITGVRKENPPPKCVTDKDLANEFADFFLDKILKIRKELDSKHLYIPYDQVDVVFNEFTTVSKEYIRKTILAMPSNSCELDILPTNILKIVLDKYLPIITRIINISLANGVFVPQWKSAIVRPLLKKSGLELILKNYRPVSSLNFLSKLLEKVALEQFLVIVRLMNSFQVTNRHIVNIIAVKRH